MKKVNLTTVMIAMAFVSLLVMSCKDNKKKQSNVQENHSEMNHDEAHEGHSMDTALKVAFKEEKMAMVFQHYIHIKTALVNTDAKEAKSGAEMLNRVTDNETLKMVATKIANTEDIETQRAAFSELTAQLETLLDDSLSSGELYKQYCPMAFNNTGGYWLSDDKEIRNPYFGDKMLKCGMVKETLQ